MQTQAPCGRKLKNTAQNPKKQPIDALIWREKLNLYLKEKGLRSTTQREKVAEIALSHPDHFEIQELIKLVQAQDSEISPATVYRSVKTLCDAGILHETLQTDTGTTLYEPHHEDHHDHIVCLDCGLIFEFHDESLESAQDRAVLKMNFEPQTHRHVVHARCQYKQNSK